MDRIRAVLLSWENEDQYSAPLLILVLGCYGIFSLPGIAHPGFQYNCRSPYRKLKVDIQEGGKGFGWGTVHHAAGSMRMPYRSSYTGPFDTNSVVDEDLRLAGTQHMYVCDMSVMPFSSAANPIRTLVALALRLSKHFG